MIQIRNVTLTHRKDLRVLVENFSCVFHDTDKIAIIGEEGNGKSTLLQWIYDPSMVDFYCEWEGQKVDNKEVYGYLPQHLPIQDESKSLYEYFCEEPEFLELSPKDLASLANQVSLPTDIFYSGQMMGSLSGGEKIKIQLLRMLMKRPHALLLDEPSNDLDLDTLMWLEDWMISWPYILIYISHDETLLEHTATGIIHMEQLQKKMHPQTTFMPVDYQTYVQRRNQAFTRQVQMAQSDLREKRIRDEKYRKLYERVNHELNSVSRQDPHTGQLLKSKMKAVKSMEKRFEKEDEKMTAMPEQEQAIHFHVLGENRQIPNGKIVGDFHFDQLTTPDGRVLANNLNLVIRGPQKVAIIGKNGCGKSTLLKQMVHQLRQRDDLYVAYMPQNYQDDLNMDQNAIENLDDTGLKEIRTHIRKALGALKFTPDEMLRPLKDLSGGQKAKVYLLKLSLSDANVLVLDEPSRNFSPLSGPVIRQMLQEFEGCIISVSHDRKYLREVCDIIYEMDSSGLYEVEMKEDV